MKRETMLKRVMGHQAKVEELRLDAYENELAAGSSEANANWADVERLLNDASDALLSAGEVLGKMRT